MLNSLEAANLDYSNTFVENLIGSKHTKSFKFIKINDILENQNNGKLLFSISDGSFPKQSLNAVDVDFQNENSYTWSGTNHRDPFTATIIKDKNGFSGSIYHYKLKDLYRIFPVTTTVSALIKMDKTHGIKPCGTLPYDPTTPTETASVVGCDTECTGHVDILFLLRPDMQEWIVQENFTASYLGVLIAELNLAFANSNILHTVGFNWVEFDWEWDASDASVPDICDEEIIALSQSSEAQSLRDQYNADIVVMLRADEPWSGTLSAGCTTEDALNLNPLGDGAYIILESQVSLKQSLFSHEIGHVFGARHKYVPVSGQDPLLFCSYPHELKFFGPDPSGNGTSTFIESLKTIMFGEPGGNFLHFSDPEIFHLSERTGKFMDTTNAGIIVPAYNNAGQIRGAGCIVADFRESPNINGSISVTEEDCLLNLSANIQPFNTDYEYSWYWSLDGLFTNEYPGISLGTGADISVEEPPVNQCDSYFLQMVILLDGEIVLNEQILQQGGICTENTQDCSEDQVVEKLSGDIQVISNIIEVESLYNIKHGQEIDYAIDLLGRVILINSEKYSIFEIHEQISRTHKGVYFLIGKDKNNNRIAFKHIAL